MSVTRDIVQSWRAHRKVVRMHLARGKSEAFIFTFLFVFMILAFVSLYPRAALIALNSPDSPLAPQLLALAMGLLASLPFWYLLAAGAQILANALGGHGSWYGARLALFWSLVAASPVVVLQGLTVGILGQGPQSTAAGIAALIAFAVFWLLAMVEVNKNVEHAP